MKSLDITMAILGIVLLPVGGIVLIAVGLSPWIVSRRFDFALESGRLIIGPKGEETGIGIAPILVVAFLAFVMLGLIGQAFAHDSRSLSFIECNYLKENAQRTREESLKKYSEVTSQNKETEDRISKLLETEEDVDKIRHLEMLQTQIGIMHMINNGYLISMEHFDLMVKLHCGT